MNKGDKKKDNQLNEWANEDRAAANVATAAAAPPNPLEERLSRETMRTLDWEEGTGEFKDRPRDVREMPGLGTALSLYDAVAGARDDEQQGTGLVRMGVNASSPELAAKLETQRRARAQESAAGGLERAVGIRRAEARGSILPLAEMDTNRRMGLLAGANSRLANSQGLYAQFRPQPSFAQRLLLAGWGQAGDAARAGAGG